MVGKGRPTHVYDSEQHGEDDHDRESELYQRTTRLSVLLSDASHHQHSFIRHIAIAHNSMNLPGVIDVPKNCIALDLLLPHPHDCLPVGLVRCGQPRKVKQRIKVCVGSNLDALNNLATPAGNCRAVAGGHRLARSSISAIALATIRRNGIRGSQNTSGTIIKTLVPIGVA
jgi:hypothetical protein